MTDIVWVKGRVGSLNYKNNYTITPRRGNSIIIDGREEIQNFN